jgi:hypothetical protein
MIKQGMLLLALLAAGPAGADEAAQAVSAAAAVIAPASTPAPSAWKNTVVTSLNAAQAHFDNWRAGGQDSLAWTVNLGGNAVWEVSSQRWDNELKLAYGQTRNGDADPQKTADNIHAGSVYTRKLNAWVNPYLGVAWDTQFNTGYQYFAGTTFTPVAVSKFMDPGYLTESLGLGYAAGDVFKLAVGAAAKQTFTDAYPLYAADGEHPLGQAQRSEYGANGMAALKLTLGQSLLFSSQLDVFSNLKAADQMNVKWGNLLSAKINSWAAANLNVDFIYDPTTSSQRQLKEGLSLSFSYNLL